MTSYCSADAKYSDQQGELASNFWSDVDYTTGQGVNGNHYVQRMFRFPHYDHCYVNNGCFGSYGMYQAGNVG